MIPVLLTIVLAWLALASLIILAFHLTAETTRARTKAQHDYFTTIDAITARSHRDAMDAFTRAASSVQEENRRTLSELTDLIHGPTQTEDEDRDDIDPATEMTGPWGFNEGELNFRDPTDDALPDEEILGYGAGGAVMESDITVER